LKIGIVTPVRPGGPYFFGKNLRTILNTKGINATWTHALPSILTAPLWQRSDIVHSSGIPITYRLWKKPLVLTVHGEFPIEKNIWQTLFPLSIRKADIITTPSYFLKEKLNLKEAIVIPNAIFPNQIKTVRHSEKNVINLVTITKFYFKDKAIGVLNIIEILDSLPTEVRTHINYSVVGGGPYLKEVMEKVKRYNVNVHFTGMLQSPNNVLNSSDIFLYYSNHDNFPTVILEAMAFGLPVITNNIGAVSEIIEQGANGFICTNYDLYDVYLLRLIRNLNLRINIGENARKTVETKFSWENVVKQYIDVYGMLI
jgi:glycosyltransferase involved in cell wall biosynthesis